MSCNLFVWYPQKRIGNDEATELYVRLCDGDTSDVIPHPAVDAFYEELTAKHPEIDRIPEEKVGDHDYIFEWAFCEDGAIRSAVGASGIEQVKGVKSRTVGDDTDRHMTRPTAIWSGSMSPP